MSQSSRRTVARFTTRVAAATLAAALLPGCLGSPDDSGGSGDIAVLAMLQEPDVLNPLFSIEGGADLSIGMVQEPLLAPKTDGTYEPVLATEVPTVENGGVSKDGRTVTFHLRDGITWSDGEPLTADDLVFTYEVLTNPKSTAVMQPAYEPVTSVVATDKLTVQVTMSRVNPQYPDLFTAILPRHRFDSTEVTTKDALAQLPLGSGPFVYTDWKAGDQIVLEANEDYWRDPELPRLDGITWKVVTDRETAVTSLVQGEFDSLWFLLSGDMPVINDAPELEAKAVDRPGLIEWLWLNHSDPDNPSEPHPVLGDPAVREAIAMAIDRQSIIDTVLDGYGQIDEALVNAGPLRCDVPPVPLDVAGAKDLLDRAGWVPGDDGVRVKDGVRASLRFTTITGSQTRELYQQKIVEYLAEIGIEVTIQNADTNVIFAGYADDGMLARGDYDMMMSLDGLRVPDPSEFVGLFRSDAIPSEDNPAGFTYTHWSNSEFDRITARAAVTLDQATRKSLYQDACELFHEEHVSVPLYAADEMNVWSSQLTGVDTDSWTGMWQTSGVANWERR